MVLLVCLIGLVSCLPHGFSFLLSAYLFIGAGYLTNVFLCVFLTGAHLMPMSSHFEKLMAKLDI